MAKKDAELEEVQAPKAEKASAHEEVKTDTANAEPAKETNDVQVVKSQPPWLFIVAGVAATALVIVVVAAAWLSLHSVAHESQRYGLRQDSTNFGAGRQGGYYGGGGAMRHMTRPTLTGVVTAVSGDTITVSGSGKQVTVKKTSSTTISGDETSVTVNDTVLVYGTTASDGTVTATRIVIRNTTPSPADSATSPSV